MVRNKDRVVLHMRLSLLPPAVRWRRLMSCACASGRRHRLHSGTQFSPLARDSQSPITSGLDDDVDDDDEEEVKELEEEAENQEVGIYRLFFVGAGPKSNRCVDHFSVFILLHITL